MEILGVIFVGLFVILCLVCILVFVSSLKVASAADDSAEREWMKRMESAREKSM